MQLSDFEYDLPQELIAQFPAEQRTDSRLLQVSEEGCWHHTFAAITGLLRQGDLLVVNNTKVIKARMFAQKDTGGQVEILLERILDAHHGLCQVRASKPLKPGRQVRVGTESLTCIERRGQFYELRSDIPLLEVLETHGHIPLPPYIERADDAKLDGERYQTVYGEVPGAVAAPTAGLHFSTALLDQLVSQGVELAQVTLHVGAGTFQPVRGDLDKHQMHCEQYEIDAHTADQIETTRARGGRIVAVGTTVVRTLESAALMGDGKVIAGQRETQLFIRPGFNFQVVDALITNFHLPGSTLIMLCCAFAGYQNVMQAYRLAVAKRYRFFSYGDAMWLECSDV